MTEKLRGTLVSSVNHFKEPTNHRASGSYTLC
jgi:hypothetical protein